MPSNKVNMKENKRNIFELTQVHNQQKKLYGKEKKYHSPCFWYKRLNFFKGKNTKSNKLVEYLKVKDD